MATVKGDGQSRATQYEKRQLQVQLTEAELLKRGESMSSAELRIEALKSERSDLSKLIGVEVKARAELAHTIERGSEERIVRCAWVEDWAANALNLVRQDTGETVDMRPMSALDRQGDLGFEAPAANGDPHAATKRIGIDKRAAETVSFAIASSDTDSPDKLHLNISKRAAKRKPAPKPAKRRDSTKLATVGEVVASKRTSKPSRKQRRRAAEQTVSA